MLRSILIYGFAFSILVHFALILFLFEEPEEHQSVVQISVEYTSGTAGPAVQAASDVNSQQSSQKPSGESQSLHAPSAIAGESLGLRARYPKLSRALGESGEVQVQANASSAYVAKSSGFKRLDDAALSAIEDALHNGKLKPNERGTFLIQFIFKLKE